MNNTMKIKGHTAVISVDPDTAQFRGEFAGLNGGAEFYGASVEALLKEGARSLQTFLDVCKERGIEPHKNFSGKFVVRVPTPLHARRQRSCRRRRGQLESVGAIRTGAGSACLTETP